MQFRLGDIVVWEAPWGTFFLGEIKALFLDNRQHPCALCQCIGDDFVGRDPFHFIASTESGLKVYLGSGIGRRQERTLPPLQPSKY